MTLSMKVTGFNVMQSAMAKRKKDLSKRRAANSNAVVVLDRWIQLNFRTEGGNVGGWKPLSRETKEAFRPGWGKVSYRGGNDSKILQDTGTGRKSWKHIVSHKEAGIINVAVHPYTREKNYMYNHDKGKGVPQRRILPTNEEIWPQIKKVYAKFIKSSIK
jgi:hypothetical protein